jgi:hypothetical protein
MVAYTSKEDLVCASAKNMKIFKVTKHLIADSSWLFDATIPSVYIKSMLHDVRRSSTMQEKTGKQQFLSA